MMYLLLCHSFVPHARTPRRSSRRLFYPDTRPSCHRTEQYPTCSNPRRWNCRFYYYTRSRRHHHRSFRDGPPDPTVQTPRIGPLWYGPRPVFVHLRPSAATLLEHGPPASPYNCSLAWASVCCSSERGKIATCHLRRIIARHIAKSSVHRSMRCTYWIVPPRRLLHVKIESNVINKMDWSI